MIIAVAGPYSAPTEEEKKLNLEAMNKAAAQLLELGHTPIIGMNAALPVLEFAKVSNRYKAIMEISLAHVNFCEAILILGDSKGVRMEKELIERKGLPVYYSIEEIRKEFSI